MIYDFDKLTDRTGSNSMKWDVPVGDLPMWVADMDFETAPEVIDAIHKKVSLGIFGYTDVPDEWSDAYISWWERRHGYKMDSDGLMFCTGVVPAISSIVRKLTTPAEKVLIQTPVYNIFYNSILNNGRVVLESPLSYKDGAYRIDYVDLEEKLSDPQTTLMVLCNPHNPIGKVWSKESLARIGDLCHKYNVVVVSDEIHCDLVLEGDAYTPFASVSKTCASNSITCIAPSKAFNLAGLQSAAIYVPDERLRHKVNRRINTDEVAEPNAFAIEASIAAWQQGGQWLDALKAYILENRKVAEAQLAKKMPGLKPVNATATYLMWIDCSEITVDTDKLCAFIREKTGLYVSKGSSYGNQGRAFVRMNLGTQRDRVLEGVNRLIDGVIAYNNR